MECLKIFKLRRFFYETLWTTNFVLFANLTIFLRFVELTNSRGKNIFRFHKNNGWDWARFTFIAGYVVVYMNLYCSRIHPRKACYLCVFLYQGHLEMHEVLLAFENVPLKFQLPLIFVKFFTRLDRDCKNTPYISLEISGRSETLSKSTLSLDLITVSLYDYHLFFIQTRNFGPRWKIIH